MTIKLNCINDAIKHSYKRKMLLPRKITAELCRKEIEIAQVIGEMNAAERILHMILKFKKEPDFNIEDVEAEIHLFLQTGLGYASKTYYGVESFKLEDILRVHGYLDKENKITI